MTAAEMQAARDRIGQQKEELARLKAITASYKAATKELKQFGKEIAALTK